MIRSLLFSIKCFYFVLYFRFLTPSSPGTFRKGRRIRRQLFWSTPTERRTCRWDLSRFLFVRRKKIIFSRRTIVSDFCPGLGDPFSRPASPSGPFSETPGDRSPGFPLPLPRPRPRPRRTNIPRGGKTGQCRSGRSLRRRDDTWLTTAARLAGTRPHVYQTQRTRAGRDRALARTPRHARAPPPPPLRFVTTSSSSSSSSAVRGRACPSSVVYDTRVPVRGAIGREQGPQGSSGQRSSGHSGDVSREGWAIRAFASPLQQPP